MQQCTEFSAIIMSWVSDYSSEIQCLQRDGFCIFKDFFPKSQVAAMGERVDFFIKHKQNLSRLRNHLQETPEDIEVGNFKFFSNEDVADPSFRVSERTSMARIVDPLITIPEINKIVFNRRLLGIATAYYQTIPKLTYVKLIKSFANSIDSADTQLFHIDGGSGKIFKAIIYLNNVIAGGGPFTYVRGSHETKFPGWERHARFSDQRIYSIFGANSIVSCYANVGDVVITETTGFHKGEKPATYDRGVLIVNYCVHPESGFEYTKIKTKRSVIEKLSDLEKLVGDELVLV